MMRMIAIFFWIFLRMIAKFFWIAIFFWIGIVENMKLIIGGIEPHPGPRKCLICKNMNKVKTVKSTEGQYSHIRDFHGRHSDLLECARCDKWINVNNDAGMTALKHHTKQRHEGYT